MSQETTNDRFKADIDEVYQLAESQESLPTAVRLSGEILALADNRWSKKRNNNEERHAELSAMMSCGVCHADVLFRAGAYADAYSVAVALMLPPTLDDDVEANATELLALSTIALMSLHSVVADMPHDKHNASHMPSIINYLASLTYAFYGMSSHPAPSSAWHGRAYPLLRDAAAEGMISSPIVVVNGKDEDPTHPGNIIGDLIGRSVAVGLMNE